jgi:hypothetical protein
MLLRLNDRGDAVKNLQLKLGLQADGHFGPNTRAAVIAFQKKNGLTADGIAGPSTLAKLNLTPAPVVATATGAKKLTTADYIAAGNFLGCHPGMVEALALKETRGAAFLADGRPKILFERHQFYKRLAIIRVAGQTLAQVTALRNKAFSEAPDICNPARGGYRGGEAEYSRLARAMTYSTSAAQESASWGQFQVMGFNAVAIGYSSVQEFVDQMHQGIDKHLVSLTRFIRATPKALKGIREQNFAMLAAAYNGPGYKANNYDVDLEKYFDQVKGKY